MANKVLKTLTVGGVSYDVKPCWSQLGLTEVYMLALLSRDEYTPVATKKPTSTDTSYTDPASGSTKYYHAGQCVTYADSTVSDGWGLSIAKHVTTNTSGAVTKVDWFHATDLETQIKALDTKVSAVI